MSDQRLVLADSGSESVARWLLEAINGRRVGVTIGEASTSGKAMVILVNEDETRHIAITVEEAEALSMYSASIGHPLISVAVIKALIAIKRHKTTTIH